MIFPVLMWDTGHATHSRPYTNSLISVAYVGHNLKSPIGERHFMIFAITQWALMSDEAMRNLVWTNGIVHWKHRQQYKCALINALVSKSNIAMIKSVNSHADLLGKCLYINDTDALAKWLNQSASTNTNVIRLRTSNFLRLHHRTYGWANATTSIHCLMLISLFMWCPGLARHWDANANQADMLMLFLQCWINASVQRNKECRYVFA